MALKLDLCRIAHDGTRSIPWADDVTQVREGQSLIREYENGKEVIKPSDTANSNAGFAGVAFSTETAVTRWPRIEQIALTAAADGAANVQANSLSKVPAFDRGSTSAYSIAVFNSAGVAQTVVAGTPGSNGQIGITATGGISTRGAAITAGTYTFVYEYVPTAIEVRTLQGDLEPGNAINAELGSNGVIIKGDIYTTEWDVEADWDATSAALGVRMTTDGRFTVSDSVANAIPGVAVIEYPTVDNEFLGLRLG